MKKLNKTLALISLALVCLICVIKINIVKADSGWDTSYDSGSSWDSGSSYSSSWSSSDYDSSYSSSSHSSSDYDSEMTSDDWIFTIFCLIITFIFVFYILDDSRYVKKMSKKVDLESEEKKKKLQEELSKYINVSLDELEKEFCEKFVKIQNAWMNFDYETLKKLCSNEIYNTYYEELEALKLKKQQNIMKDFAKYKDSIIGYKIENNILTIEYHVLISFKDYVINTDTDEVVKGNKNREMCVAYRLEFSKSLDNNKSSCPNCGGSIEPGTTKCSHCKAVIVQDSSEFVMSSKRRV